jgi:hypothetical protein
MMFRCRGGFSQPQRSSSMAEISKLSVSKLLDKLRSNDQQKKTKDMQRDEQLEKMNEELRRLRNPGQRDGG